MTTLSYQATDLLYPLSTLYMMLQLSPPMAQRIEPDRMPLLPRRLLVHENDMTPTLESHHRVTLHLRLLQRRLVEHAMFRMVVLLRDSDNAPVEFGAIRIALSQLPNEARSLVIENRRPLGAILADHAITHRSRPRGFFTLTSDETIGEALGLAQPSILFGRANVLLNHHDQPLAEVVEILPLM